MKTNNIMVGKFSTNEWINNDFKGFAFKKANKNAKHKFFVMLNPYEPITECGKIPKELKKKDTIKDTDGHILKVVDFGGSGLFGKDHWSWTWIGFYCLNGEFVKQQ